MTGITEPLVDEPTTIDADLASAAGPDEGDIAADYLEELLDLADLDGDIEIATRAGRVYLSIEADEQDALRTLSKPDT
ncbi:MAG: DNA-binding protein, partial [Rhodoglobus sp.]|nr:DNA-binding protein [Rhodoglobus sp.]